MRDAIETLALFAGFALTITGVLYVVGLLIEALRQPPQPYGGNTMRLMSLFRGPDQTIRATIEEVTTRVVRDALRDAARTIDRYKEVSQLQDTVTSLKEKIEALRIEKDRKEEEFARREREVEHKVGLDRKRSEFEREAAEREAKLGVREENLAAQKEAFEERMKFLTVRFEEEVKYQRELLEKLLKRLPSAEIYADLSGRNGDERRLAAVVDE